MKILFFIYHCVWHIGLWTARRLQVHLPLKLRNYLAERDIAQLVWRQPPRSGQRRIWFHAASGEIEYIRPLLRLWKEKHPEDLLFLTYFSTSARSMIQPLQEIDGWAPLPFDLPQPCEQFIRHLQPHILIISRTDLWPTILEKMGDRPKLLIASTWTQGSRKAVGAGRWMSLWCMQYLNKICVVTDADKAFLQTINPKIQVAVTGDPRFDQVAFRLQQQRPLPAQLQQWAQERSLFIAGSTWPEDEQVLLNSWKTAATAGQRLLLVPHETSPEHLNELTEKFKALALPFTLWSQAHELENSLSSDILIFDQKGWLAELYQLADIAFIGGSFKKQVHSVMEALGCGLPVIVGPHYLNNREAIEFHSMKQMDTHFVEVVTDSDSLTHQLKKHWQRSAPSNEELQAHIRKAFLARCSATTSTYREIQEWL